MAVSPAGGVRQRTGERWDLLPWQPLRWVARIYAYGAAKYSDHNWKNLDPRSEQCPQSHGVAHAFEAMEYPERSPERCWLLAKAAWNMIAQLWFELKGGEAESGYAAMRERMARGEWDG